MSTPTQTARVLAPVRSQGHAGVSGPPTSPSLPRRRSLRRCSPTMSCSAHTQIHHFKPAAVAPISPGSRPSCLPGCPGSALYPCAQLPHVQMDQAHTRGNYPRANDGLETGNMGLRPREWRGFVGAPPPPARADSPRPPLFAACRPTPRSDAARWTTRRWRLSGWR